MQQINNITMATKIQGNTNRFYNYCIYFFNIEMALQIELYPLLLNTVGQTPLSRGELASK